MCGGTLVRRFFLRSKYLTFGKLLQKPGSKVIILLFDRLSQTIESSLEAGQPSGPKMSASETIFLSFACLPLCRSRLSATWRLRKDKSSLPVGEMRTVGEKVQS